LYYLLLYNNNHLTLIFLFTFYDRSLEIFPKGNGEERKNFVSMYLYNNDIKNGNNTYICTKYMMFIRNYEDYSCFFGKGI